MNGVSILVPAHNEAAYLPDCLGALLASDPVAEDVEVIVIANGCTDATAEVARGFSDKAARKGWRLVVLDLAEEYGSVGNWLADWPADDTVGMWLLLKKRGKQLGGNSGAAFLRMVGRDTWYPTGDVIAALKAQNIIDKPPASQRDQRSAQAAFNVWQQESGWPQAHISKVLAFTIG